MSKHMMLSMSLFIGAILTSTAQVGYSETKFTPALIDGQSEAEYYRSELTDLYKLDDFKAMKNSYVLGLETLCLLPRRIPTGGTYTLLDVEGQGSLRHIWETRSPETADFEFEIFIDGETTPSIKGRFPDLIAAAQRASQPFVLNPGGTIPNLSHNFYLPIPFESSLRIDIANLMDNNGLIFLQLDYRLEDDSMEGINLVQTGEDSQITLAYTGAPLAEVMAPVPSSTQTSLQHSIMGNGEFTVVGPAIIRKFAMDHVTPGVRMNVFFDDEPTPSIDVDIADFFGPFEGSAFASNTCYLPMPFAENMKVVLSGASNDDEWNFDIEAEPVGAFQDDWGYFHARGDYLLKASGYDQFQVLNTTGRGKWLGMSLYNTEHDHGGGDFAVIDGGTASPSFLHGINGEDYFSFAFFGNGENFPYSEAFSNEEGRMRLHLENPYVFNESINISWGVTKDVNPRSVAYWYQEDAQNNTLSAEEANGLRWKVFGPVGVPLLEDGNTPDVSDPEKLFAALPLEADLDAGKSFDAFHIMFSATNTGTFNGWADQYAVGNHLNLMYIYGHVMDLGGYMHMGYYARCMMAKTEFASTQMQKVKFQISYDDPLVVEVNGKKIFEDMELRRGFTTQTFDVTLVTGDNKLVVKMLDTPNNNTCWAGIALKVLDEQGGEITLDQYYTTPRITDYVVTDSYLVPSGTVADFNLQLNQATRQVGSIVPVTYTASSATIRAATQVFLSQTYDGIAGRGALVLRGLTDGNGADAIAAPGAGIDQDLASSLAGNHYTISYTGLLSDFTGTVVASPSQISSWYQSISLGGTGLPSTPEDPATDLGFMMGFDGLARLYVDGVFTQWAAIPGFAVGTPYNLLLDIDEASSLCVASVDVGGVVTTLPAVSFSFDAETSRRVLLANRLFTTTLTGDGWDAVVDGQVRDFQIKIIREKNYETWVLVDTGLTQGVNDALTDDAEPGGGDGINNLLEYALGGNPLVNDAFRILPSLIISDEMDAKYVFRRRSDAADRGLLYNVLLNTSNLVTSSFSNVSNSLETAVAPINPDFESVTNALDITELPMSFLTLDVVKD